MKEISFNSRVGYLSLIPQIILIISIVLGIVLRIIVALQNRSFWWDESVNFLVSQLPITDLIQGNYGNFYTHPPLYFLILKLLSVISIHETWLRSISIIPSIFLIILLYFFTKRLTSNSLIAILASFFFATSTFHIYYSSFVKVVEITLLFNLFTLYFYIGYVKTKQTVQVVLYSIFLWVSLITGYYSIWLIFILFFSTSVGYLVKKVDIKQLKNMCIGSLTVILLYLPWLLKLVLGLNNTGEMQQSNRLTKLNDLWSIYSNFGAFIDTQPLIVAIFVLIMVYGLTKTSSLSRHSKFMLLLWLFFPPIFIYVAILVVYIINHSYIFNYSPWYVSFSSLPFYIILAVLSAKKNRLLPFILTSYLLINFFSYKQFLQTPKENWRGASNYLFYELGLNNSDILFTDDPTHFTYYKEYLWRLPQTHELKSVSAFEIEREGLIGIFSQIEISLELYHKSCLATIFIKRGDLPPKLSAYLIQPTFTENPYVFCFRKNT